MVCASPLTLAFVFLTNFEQPHLVVSLGRKFARDMERYGENLHIAPKEKHEYYFRSSGLLTTSRLFFIFVFFCRGESTERDLMFVAWQKYGQFLSKF